MIPGCSYLSRGPTRTVSRGKSSLCACITSVLTSSRQATRAERCCLEMLNAEGFNVLRRGLASFSLISEADDMGFGFLVRFLSIFRALFVSVIVLFFFLLRYRFVLSSSSYLFFLLLCFFFYSVFAFAFYSFFFFSIFILLFFLSFFIFFRFLHFSLRSYH